MKTVIFALLFTFGAVGLWAAVASSPAQAQSAGATTAGSQSATFAIENMTCALCPVTVRNAMESVSGVKSVSVDFENKHSLGSLGTSGLNYLIEDPAADNEPPGEIVLEG